MTGLACQIVVWTTMLNGGNRNDKNYSSNMETYIHYINTNLYKSGTLLLHISHQALSLPHLRLLYDIGKT